MARLVVGYRVESDGVCETTAPGDCCPLTVDTGCCPDDLMPETLYLSLGGISNFTLNYREDIGSQSCGDVVNNAPGGDWVGGDDGDRRLAPGWPRPV